MSARNPGLGFAWFHLAIAEEREYRKRNYWSSGTWSLLYAARVKLGPRNAAAQPKTAIDGKTR